jgi:hypothetical protein
LTTGQVPSGLVGCLWESEAPVGSEGPVAFYTFL